MALSNTTLFFNDLLHQDVSTSVVTAGASAGSDTENGWSVNQVRYSDNMRGWKPPNGANDNWIQIDGGSTTWAGSAGQYIWWAAAADTRGVTAGGLRVYQDISDNPAGTFSTYRTSLPVPMANSPVVSYATHVLSPKQYYRIKQLNVDRGGSTVTIPIYRLSAYAEASLFKIHSASPYVTDIAGPGELALTSRAAIQETLAGMILSNKTGWNSIEFELTFRPASETLWQNLSDQLYNIGISKQSIFMIFEGLDDRGNDRNACYARVVGGAWNATRAVQGAYDTTIIFRTEAFPIGG